VPGQQHAHAGGGAPAAAPTRAASGIGEAHRTATTLQGFAVPAAIDDGKCMAFTAGVVRTSVQTSTLSQKTRDVGRAMRRKVTG
jgi:hypothetical protein